MTNIINNENTANYSSNGLSIVGTNGRPSAYGMFDMNGNIGEWTDTNRDDISGFSSSGIKSIRGGHTSSSLHTAKHDTVFGVAGLTGVTRNNGLRVASFTNPFNLPNFALVGDINNTADDAPLLAPNKRVGSVSYTYFLNQYELTLKEYVIFLNAIAKTDTYSTYDWLYMTNSFGISIVQSGSSGNYSYSIGVYAGLGSAEEYEDLPAFGISWYSAARYCNWLHNNKPNGPQNSTTTENGAYPLNGLIGGPLETSVEKNSNAKYHIPTDDEWYKAAYYKGGGTDSGYWAYATQSDTLPNKICQNNKGFVCPTPTPTISLTPSTSLTASVTPSKVTRTPTPTRTPTRTPTKTIAATRTPTKTVTASRSPTKTQTQTATPTKTVTATRSPTKTVTATRTPTKTTTATRTATPTPTPTPVPGNGLYRWSLDGNNNPLPIQIGDKDDWIDIACPYSFDSSYIAIDSAGYLYGWTKNGFNDAGVSGHTQETSGLLGQSIDMPIEPTIVSNVEYGHYECCYKKVFVEKYWGRTAFAISKNGSSVFNWGWDSGEYFLGNGTYPSKDIIAQLRYPTIYYGVPVGMMNTLSSADKITTTFNGPIHSGPSMAALRNGELWGWGGRQGTLSSEYLIAPRDPVTGELILDLQSLYYFWGPTRMGYESNWIDISENLAINTYGKLYAWLLYDPPPLGTPSIPNGTIYFDGGFYSKRTQNNIGIVFWEISDEYNWAAISSDTTSGVGRTVFAINRLGELYSVTNIPAHHDIPNNSIFNRIGSDSNWVFVKAGPGVGYAINALGELHTITANNTTARVGNRNDWRQIAFGDGEVLAIANNNISIPSLPSPDMFTPLPTRTPTRTPTPTLTTTATASSLPWST